MKFRTALIIASTLAAIFPAAGFARDRLSDAPITARVVQGWTLPDGRMIAGLELTLAKGWKTYWRAPGDAGIPPLFNWARTGNLNAAQVSWPTPFVFHQNGMRSIGYKDRVVLPLYITPRKAGRDVRLRGVMDLGVCSDICVPHRLKFDAKLAAAPTAPVPQIAAALAQTPFTKKEAGVKSATCDVRPSDSGMKVTVRVHMPSAGAPEVTVIEPGIPDVWVSEAQTSRSGAWVQATAEMVHPEGGAFAVNRSALRITVLGGSHAVDIKGCTAG